MKPLPPSIWSAIILQVRIPAKGIQALAKARIACVSNVHALADGAGEILSDHKEDSGLAYQTHGDPVPDRGIKEVVKGV